MTTIAPIILSDGVLIEKIAVKAQDLLAFTTEMKEKRPEEYALFQKMFEKSVASLEKANEAERVAKEKEAKRLADEEKKATTKAMEKYIMERFSWVMKKGKESYCEGNHSGELAIGFLRNERWDAEAFDTFLNNHAGDAEDYLNGAKSGTNFTVSVRSIYDKCHKDGLSKKWVCEFSWEESYDSPFDECYSSGDAVCDDSDSDDDYE